MANAIVEEALKNKKMTAAQAPQVAEAIKQTSGVDVPEEAITAKNIEAVIKQKPKGTAMDKDNQRLLFAAIGAALPTVLGAAFGGAQGGALGAQAGAGIAGTIGSAIGKEEEQKKAQAMKAEQDAKDFAQKKELKELDLDARKGADADRQIARQSAQDFKAMTLEDRRTREQEKRDEKLQSRTVPGLGVAATVEDAKKLKDGLEEKNTFDRKIDEMIALRKEYGGEVLNREAVARGKQLSKDLLLTYKNMAKLGVLSAADEAIINAIIPDDPLAYSFGGTGNDPILANLEKFRADSNASFQDRIATRIVKPDMPAAPAQVTPEDERALAWAQANSNDPRAAAIIETIKSKQMLAR